MVSLTIPLRGISGDLKKDMEQIFSDSEIIKLEDDYESPGVFIKVRNPEQFSENDLSDYKVYNMITNKKNK